MNPSTSNSIQIPVFHSIWAILRNTMYSRMLCNHIQVERSDNNRIIVFPPTQMNITAQRISLVRHHLYPLVNRRKMERRKKEVTSRSTSIHCFIDPLYENDGFIAFNTIGDETDVLIMRCTLEAQISFHLLRFLSGNDWSLIE